MIENMLYGPYTAGEENGKNVIHYQGNQQFPSFENAQDTKLASSVLSNRVNAIANEEWLYHLHKIDHLVFLASVEYFSSIGADWCNLPLTTMMISSPGEVYAGQTIDYTTDALPVNISWFDNDRQAFLAESSQFYLELRLLMQSVDQVFSVYNSFRKEVADFSHLAEFQHIEYEGKVDGEKNIQVFLGLLQAIVKKVLTEGNEHLLPFLTETELSSLEDTFTEANITRLTLKEALARLYAATGDEKYQQFTVEHFGSWEEIKLTELLGTHALVTEYPLMEIPFYHTQKKDSDGDLVADNADFILYGYREVVGSGVRIIEEDALAEKAKVFNLPAQDYEPYLQMRSAENYQQTAGFGLGWQRLTHWLLKLPYIWEASHVPRGEYLPKP